MAGIKQFIEALTEPVKLAVAAGQDGAEFAALFLFQHGEPAIEAYKQLLPMGENVLQYIHMYPPLGSFASEHPQEFQAFLGQFLDAPRVDQILIAASQQPKQAPGPRRVQRPVPPGTQTQ